jgi:hypothetical protein
MTTLLTDIIDNINLPDDDLDLIIEDFISDHNYYFGSTATEGASGVDYATTALEWREEEFHNTWNQAYRSQGYVVVDDNIRTNIYRDDMLAYDGLFDGDPDTAILFSSDPASGSFTTTSPSGAWISIEYPIERTTNLIKINIDESDISVCFGYSVDNINWSFLSAPLSAHTGTLREYTTFEDALDNYYTLSGDNTLNTTFNFRMRYFKIFFVPDENVTDINVSLLNCGQQTYIEDLAAGTIDTSKLVISSPDGKTTFDGNTITIRDANNVVRVELGLLS